jgi:hypothetical protein
VVSEAQSRKVERNLPRAAGCYLRELREAMRQRASIREYHLMGLGKRGRFAVDQPTITG